MNANATIRSYLNCLASRIMVVPIYTVPALVNLLIAAHLAVDPYMLLCLGSTVTLTSYSIYWYNDYRDAEPDRENSASNTQPAQRPFASGKISKNLFLAYIAFTVTAGILFAAILNIYVFALQVSFLFLGYLYSTEPFRLKRRAVGKNLTVVLGAVISCLSGAMVYKQILPQNFYSVLITALLYIGGPTLGDIRDVYGDRQTGAKTLPVIFGPVPTIRFCIAIFCAVIVAGLIGYYDIGFNASLPILTALIMVTWIYAVYPLLNKWQDSAYVEKIVYRRIVPANTIVQIIPLVGMMML